ncbi:MAG TPA: response regulator [Verrucomicrobiae bacterium]|nr:response regulator [Verrucomicrobiae bacterium]
MPPAAPGQTNIPRRILVVEDEALVAHTIRMALTVDGHTVDVVEDGEKALAAFNPELHDLVITDFRLPNMDGLEVAQAVKERCPGKPVILMTAHIEAISDRTGKVSNVDLLMGKPFSIRDLQQAIGKLLPIA